MRIAWLICPLAAAAVEPSVGSPCRAPFAADEARAARVLALAGASPGVTVCFGPEEGAGVLPSGVLLLDAKADDRSAAARVAHLLVHVREGAPGEPPGDPGACAAWLARARDAEIRADAVEARVAASLGVAPPARSVDARVAEYAKRCP